MMQPTLEELEKQAEEIMSKSEKSEKLDPEEVSEDAAEDSEEEEEAEEAEEEPDEDEDEADEDEDGGKEEIKKAVVSEAIGGDGKVPETMGAIVEIFAKSLADVIDNVAASKESADSTSTVLAKSLMAQNVLLSDLKAGVDKANRENVRLRKSLNAMEAKLESFGSQPAHMRKSVASYSVTDRNFKGSLEGTEGAPEPLSKAQVLAILNGELKSGSQIVIPQDVVNAECGAPMRDEVRALIESKRTR